MSVAPYDPLAAVHQRNLRLYAADVQARINPSTPGQIPSLPVNGSGGFGGSGDGLGSGESGWARSERFQNAAGNAFSSGGSGWQDFSKGRPQQRPTGSGTGEIDGKPSLTSTKPKLDFPSAASTEQRQGLAYEFAASFQEYARDALKSLGIGRRTASV